MFQKVGEGQQRSGIESALNESGVMEADTEIGCLCCIKALITTMLHTEGTRNNVTYRGKEKQLFKNLEDRAGQWWLKLLIPALREVEGSESL